MNYHCPKCDADLTGAWIDELRGEAERRTDHIISKHKLMDVVAAFLRGAPDAVERGRTLLASLGYTPDEKKDD